MTTKHIADHKDIENGMSDQFKQQMANVRELSNALLALFRATGGVNLNCRLDKNKTTVVNFIEATVQLPSKEYIPYCRAIHIEELQDKVSALYQLFKSAPDEVKRSPQAILDLMDQNAQKDPRLEIAKTDIVALFTRLAIAQNVLLEMPDDLSEKRTLH